MASASLALTMASASHKGLNKPTSEAIFKPSRSAVSVRQSSSSRGQNLQVQASIIEKVVTGLAAAVLTASIVVPQVAETAGQEISRSLKIFLLSIVAGGVVLVVIRGAAAGVFNFDPVKRS
ncbi:hypothetical protein Nepgr_014232 [Nepenthes gracilis]|uniref:Uncharacterized protein n=1 Tax=Nepenthes gracilis TaxID=150966 RepID=A0AAD3XQ36_NEPGR|nr:hypothetical protein Nepgr_014232 [Nepenthes gracilis]